MTYMEVQFTNTGQVGTLDIWAHEFLDNWAHRISGHTDIWAHEMNGHMDIWAHEMTGHTDIWAHEMTGHMDIWAHRMTTKDFCVPLIFKYPPPPHCERETVGDIV